MPSFYEDVAFYEILFKLQGKIEKAMKEQGINLPNMSLIEHAIYFSIKCDGYKSALSRSYIILFGKKYFIFFNLIFKIVQELSHSKTL